MKKILLFGAGKSATSLIRYLIETTAGRGWQLVVAESNLALAQSKTGDAPHARALSIDVAVEPERDALVAGADIVISLLPPSLHYLVAQSCVKNGKNLLTASYLDPAIRSLEPAINSKNLLFLCEMGLDPGIDHMSALQLISRIKQEGGHIHSFYSHTGGLVAPESDDNPWHYKISWNPRNVVLAGSAGAAYRESDQVVERPYRELFAHPGRVTLPTKYRSIGPLAWYPNRDSLSYIPLYDLAGAATFIRTTLRYPEYCHAWQGIVSAGLTDDKSPVDPQGLTYVKWAAPLLPFVDPHNKKAYEYLGLFSPGPVPAAARTSADILQHLLETKLAMQPNDKDMIVMIHEIGYTRTGKEYKAQSTLVIEGEDSRYTAMARTVGLPLGIAAILLLEGRISLTGLHIPILPAIYEPVMSGLERQGIRFEHTLAHIDAEGA